MQSRKVLQTQMNPSPTDQTGPTRSSAENMHAQSTQRKKFWPALFSAMIRVTGVILVLCAIPIFLALGVYGYYQISGLIVEGIWVRSISLSGLTLPEAAARLEENYNADPTLTLVDSDDPTRIWQMHPAVFGLGIDSWATAESAHAIGHRPSITSSVMGILIGFKDGFSLEPIPRLNVDLARSELSQWATIVEVPSIDGSLHIEGTEAVGSPGIAGKELDIDKTMIALAADPLAVLEYGFLPLVMKPIPPAIGDVSPWVAEAESLIHSNLKLSAYDPVLDQSLEWDPSPKKFASWIIIERNDDAFQISLDRERIKDDLQDWIASFGSERDLDLEIALAAALDSMEMGQSDPLIVHYLPTIRQVKPGETLTSIAAQVGIPYWKIMEFNPQITGRGLVTLSSITIPPPDAMLPLPVVPNKRIVISIPDQHLWAYQDGECIYDFVISTGIDRSPTMAGIFQVQSHEINAYASNWDLYMPNFMGIYEAVPGFMNGIHGLPLLSNGRRLWANVLGEPASFGCIILDLEPAEQLYSWAEDGVVVEIQP